MTLLLLLLFRHKCSETRRAGLFPRRLLSLSTSSSVEREPEPELLCRRSAVCSTKTVQQAARGRLKVGSLALSGAVYR